MASQQSQDVSTYIAAIPAVAKPRFDELRAIVQQTVPNATEVISYGVLGYRIGSAPARIFIAGFKDHVALYPIPKDTSQLPDLEMYRKGKGTLWFSLHQPLPKALIEQVVQALSAQQPHSPLAS